MELQEYRFDEVSVNYDKKRVPLSGAQREKRKGDYRYYGAQGVIDYVDDYIFDGTFLLIAEDGENLKSKKQNIAQVVNGQFWVNNHAHVVTGNELCDTHYLCYLINSMDLSGYVTGSAQPKLSQANLNAVTLLLPQIEIQKNIVDYLRKIDEKIELNTQINENLLQQALAIYKAWFCDYVLSDGVLPESWHITTIDALSSLVTRGIAPKYDDSSTQIVLNQKCIRDHTIDVSLARRHLPKKINEKWVSKGDLLINSTGTGTLGRVAQVWFDANNMTVDSHVTIVRPKAPILQSYIGFWGLSHESEIEAQHTGSTGQTELPRDRVKAMELTLPDEDTLSKFNELVIPITEAVVSNQKENVRLSQLRDTLLPKLMSGEIDVSELEP